MDVAIIDYGSGNLRSAQKSVERAASACNSAHRISLVTTAEAVKSADRLILPGVGAFADCAAGIKAIDGMWQAVHEHAIVRAKPFLGICVGMQLMADAGLEHGSTEGFGWVPGQVDIIPRGSGELRIPHMGWNTVELNDPHHPLFSDIKTGGEGLHAYFVHSYHLIAADDRHVLAQTTYGSPLTAAVAKDNLVGTQFHPEKSQQLGLRFLENFLKWAP